MALQWSELAEPWQACLEETWRAYCAGVIPIGAVVTDEIGRVVTRAHNRIYLKNAPPRQVCSSELAHAELNALLALGPRPKHIHDYAIYTAVEPCPLCMGAIYMSGVRRIYFASEDAYAGSTNLLGRTWYLDYKPVRVSGPRRDALGDLACALNMEFIMRRYSGQNDVVTRQRQAYPRGVQLGEELLASGQAQKWVADGKGIAEVWEEWNEQLAGFTAGGEA